MKSKKNTALTLLGLLFLSTVLTVGSANAVALTEATGGILFTTDTEDNPQFEFDGVETIRIKWFVNGLIDIEIHEDTKDGQLVTDGLPNLKGLPATGSVDVTLPPGKYCIVGTGAEAIQVCSGSIFVAPESVIGALSAVGACFLAVGTVAAVKRKRA